MKIMVLGYSESGKTTAAEILGELLGLDYANTSDQLIKEFAEEHGLSQGEILENKSLYRRELFNFGRARQAENPLWPQDIQLKHASILTGLRNPNEIMAARSYNLYDLIIWINRPNFGPNETDRLDSSYADVVIDNDGSIAELRGKLTAAVADPR